MPIAAINKGTAAANSVEMPPVPVWRWVCSAVRSAVRRLLYVFPNITCSVGEFVRSTVGELNSIVDPVSINMVPADPLIVIVADPALITTRLPEESPVIYPAMHISFYGEGSSAPSGLSGESGESGVSGMAGMLALPGHDHAGVISTMDGAEVVAEALA